MICPDTSMFYCVSKKHVMCLVHWHPLPVMLLFTLISCLPSSHSGFYYILFSHASLYVSVKTLGNPVNVLQKFTSMQTFTSKTIVYTFTRQSWLSKSGFSLFIQKPLPTLCFQFCKGIVVHWMYKHWDYYNNSSLVSMFESKTGVILG